MARERTLKYAAADINRIALHAPIYVINENEELSFYLGREAPQITGARNTARSIEQPVYLFAYRGNFRAPWLLFCAGGKLTREWDRAGGSGLPALYRLPPECVKPQFVLGKWSGGPSR